MHKEFTLALNHTFFERPRLLLDILDRFSSLPSFLENFDSFFQTRKFSKESQSFFKKSLQSFSLPTLEKKLANFQIQTLFITDSDYPSLLKELPDPPAVLFYKGNLQLTKQDCLGVVGSREMSLYGEQATDKLVKELAPYFIITSGMATGIDGKAHQTALDAGYPSIAVLGTSLCHIYPAHHKPLFKTLCEKGLVLSEYPPHVEPNPRHFPQRNRLISGLSKGILVVEATPKSGSLITARLAMEQNREVFAVPGSILSELSIGPHQLIQDGAKLAMTKSDILAEFMDLTHPPKAPTATQNIPADLSSEEMLIYTLLEESPHTVDDLLEKTELSPSQLMQSLTYFELNQWIEEGPGNRYHIRTL